MISIILKNFNFFQKLVIQNEKEIGLFIISENDNRRKLQIINMEIFYLTFINNSHIITMLCEEICESCWHVILSNISKTPKLFRNKSYQFLKIVFQKCKIETLKLILFKLNFIETIKEFHQSICNNGVMVENSQDDSFFIKSILTIINDVLQTVKWK